MKLLDNASLLLVIVGALNWLLIGLIKFDLVASIFGNMSLISRAVYLLVGLCGFYAVTIFGRIRESRGAQA